MVDDFDTGSGFFLLVGITCVAHVLVCPKPKLFPFGHVFQSVVTRK